MIHRIPIDIRDAERKNLRDKFQSGGPDSPLKGRVRIYERKIDGDKKLYLVEDTSNLILYRGRNWLAQRAFNSNMSARSVNPSWKDLYLNWFAVGSRGSTSDPLVPASPTLQDYQLGNQLPISSVPASDFITVSGVQFHAFDSTYPQFLYDTDVNNSTLWSGCQQTDNVQGLSNMRCDGFLIGLIKVTVTSNECNGPATPGYQDINEAGLFFGLASPTLPTDLGIFSRVCFSTIRKDVTRELVFSWYIYF